MLYLAACRVPVCPLSVTSSASAARVCLLQRDCKHELIGQCFTSLVGLEGKGK